MKVLVVEDDVKQRQLLERGLKKSKFNVVACASVNEAIESLSENEFSVAVVDLGLFDQNGYDFVRELVRNSLKTKVIIHTADATFESAKEGIELGIFAYVEKTRGLGELLKQVELASTSFLIDSLTRAQQEIRLQIGLLDSVREGVIATNLQRTVIFANRFAVETLGFCEQEIYGKNVTGIFDCPNLDRSNPNLEVPWLYQGFDGDQTWESEFALPIQVGNKSIEVGGIRDPLSFFKIKVSPIQDTSNAMVGHVIVFSDVTKQRLAEFELEKSRQLANHAQRIAILGQMAGGLAHEINQPLGAISNYSGGLILGLQNTSVTDEELRSTLFMIQNQALRASEVIGQLRRFVSSSPSSPETVEVSPLISETLKLMECDFRTRRATVILNLTPIPLHFLGDKVQLSQVLVNILRNAAEAVDYPESSQREILVSTTFEQGSIWIEIADNGQGMNDEVRARIFEPYFTTKKGGLGLGLSISNTIMENHGGKLNIGTSSTGGVTVRLQLPIATEREPG